MADTPDPTNAPSNGVPSAPSLSSTSSSPSVSSVPSDAPDILAAATGTKSEELLVPAKEEPDTPTGPPPEPPPQNPKKRLPIGALISVVLFFLITLPLAVHVISQRNQLAELRKQAAEAPGVNDLYAGGPNAPSANGCTEGAIECNDAGGVNYCSGGKWSSRPKNPGETCTTPSACVEEAKECNSKGEMNYRCGTQWYSRTTNPGETCSPSSGNPPAGPFISVTKIIPTNLQIQLYAYCYLDYIANNHKPSDAKKACDNLQSEAEKIGLQVPSVQIPDVTNPFKLNLGLGEYGYCVFKGIQDFGKTRTEASSACQRLITNPELPRSPDIQIQIPATVIPVVRDVANAEFLLCVGTGLSPAYDLNIETAKDRCKRLLTDPELPTGPNIQIQTPPILKDAQYGGCVISEIINNKTRAQAENNCSTSSSSSTTTSSSTETRSCIRLLIADGLSKASAQYECGQTDKPPATTGECSGPGDCKDGYDCNVQTKTCVYKPAPGFECARGGETPKSGFSCCPGLDVINGDCGVTRNTCPNSRELAPDGNACFCVNPPAACAQPKKPIPETTPLPGVTARNCNYGDKTCKVTVSGTHRVCTWSGVCDGSQERCGPDWNEIINGTASGVNGITCKELSGEITVTAPNKCGTWQADIAVDGVPQAGAASFVPCPAQIGSPTVATGGGGGGGTAPQCQSIKIYKGGQVVTPSTLRAGDDVLLAAVAPTAATKARFRVNGGSWQETTTKNGSNEFTLAFTIPSATTNFTVEAQLFINGQWQ